jgi:hypothetical protein
LPSQIICAECLETVFDAVTARNGELICAGCAAAYYVACAGCGGLIPSEVAMDRDGKGHCPDCFARAALDPDIEPPTDEETEALVAEYIALHSDEKRIKARLDFIKDRLKSAAAAKQRIAGAVVLRSDAGEVRCSYSVKLRCDDEKVAALEPLLGYERFTSLFDRKVSFTPLKESIKEFLSDDARESDALKRAVRDAVAEIETPSLSVPRQKK